MEQDNNGNPLMLLSCLTAYISIGTAQQYISLGAGIVAILSGICAIRYYIIKAKK